MFDIDDDEEQKVEGLLPDGSPDPDYAAALGLVPASPGRRSLAFTIDAAIVAVLALPAVFATVALLPVLADTSKATLKFVLLPLILFGASETLISIFYVVQLVLHGRRGTTVGKAICRIRSVRVTTFERPGFWRMLWRAVVFAFAAMIVPVLGAIPVLLSPLWDMQRRGRGWLDRVGGNWLLDVKNGLDPFDTTALRRARKRVAAGPEVQAAPLPSLATRSADPLFVPGTRSSSGVVGGAVAPAQPGEAWTPPSLRPEAAPANRPAEAPATRPAESAPEPGPAVATGCILVFDDGTQVAIAGDVLLGRNPQPREGETVRHLLPIEDPLFQISKTHAVLGLDATGAWIADRASVNGTWLVTNVTDGQRLPVSAEGRTPLPWGSVIQLGGRTFSVQPQQAVQPQHSVQQQPAPAATTEAK